MATIEIDGKKYEAEAGQMLIDATDANGIDVPRFCYHKKLSVAANCRMCLVDVEKAPKPLPACATPVMDGMVIRTLSDRAQSAQKSVMEFLLINHPLDCPICDQGGECELQDVAVGYGQDVSRFTEIKRVVPDKNLGSLIATEMTRCIHCTRCVRFSAEIAGVREMGAPGRGEHTRIGTYIEKTIDSELSGNMIDVCPVGALTSKPFRFEARAWEMQQRETISPHDLIGSNMYLHIRRNQVMRVVPKENEAVNEVWISDRDRFSYEALYTDDRLTLPMIKQEGQWKTTDWETALQYAVDGLKKVQQQHGGGALGGLASDTANLEELFLFQQLLRGLGSANIDHRLRQVDFSDQNEAPLYPYLGQSIVDLEKTDTALIIGSNLRKEQPLINHRLRKAMFVDLGKISESCVGKMMVLNPIDYEFNIPLAEKIVCTDWVNALSSIAKALLDKVSDKAPQGVVALLKDVKINVEQQAIADQLLAGQHVTILVGQLASSHPQASTIRALAGMISQMANAHLGYLAASANSAGAALVGVLPHRDMLGASSAGHNAHEMLSQALKAYVLLGVEVELDSCLGHQAVDTLKQAEFVIGLNAYQSEAMLSYADVLLPIALFPETSGTYVNGEGRWQSASGVVKPQGEARPGWKVLRVLNNLCGVSDCDYISSEQIREHLQTQLSQQDLPNANASWAMPDVLPSVTTDLSIVCELPLYAVDEMVRRAPALQKTQDALSAQGLHINQQQAQNLGLIAEQSATVTQNGVSVKLDVVIDKRVPNGTALLYAGNADRVKLGAWHSTLSITS